MRLRRGVVAGLTIGASLALPSVTHVEAEEGPGSGELLVNPGFETGDFTGWRLVKGRFLVTNAPAFKLIPGPAAGYSYLRGEKGRLCTLEQVVPVPPGARGGVELRAHLAGAQKDAAMVTLETLGAGLHPLTAASTDEVKSGTWVERRIHVDLAEAARYLRVRISAVRYDGTWSDGYADALSLRIVPPLEETLDPETGRKVAELAVPALAARAQDVDDPRLREAAAVALSARGADGWIALGNAALNLLESGHEDPAVALTRRLAEGDQSGRRAELRRIVRAVPGSRVRDEALQLLARRYPQEKEFLELVLKTPGGANAAFVRELAARGAPDELLHAALDDPYLARAAYEALRVRGVQVGAPRLGLVAIELAERAHTKSEADRDADRLHADPDLHLAEALVGLLGTESARRRGGAHLLLLRLSGLDVEPDDERWTVWAAEFGPRSPLPRPGSPGSIRASVLRGQRYLLGLLTGSGRVASGHPVRGKFVRGTTALAVHALLASGVDRDHPGIQRAMVETVFNGDETVHTYTLKHQVLASVAFDLEGLRGRLRGIRDQMLAAQHAGGGWGSECSTRAKRPGPNLHDTARVVVALAALRDAGLQVPRRVFAQAEKELLARHRSSKRSHGWGTRKGKRPDFGSTVRGFAALLTCRSILYGGEAGDAPIVARGALDTGHYLFSHAGFGDRSLLSYVALERACGLLAIETFAGLDWYAAGVEELVATQDDDGAWQSADVRPALRKGGQGAGRETAYALQFLARATAQEVRAHELADVDVPQRGPAHHTAEPGAKPPDDAVRAWQVSDRIRLWHDRSRFPDVDAADLDGIRRSAEAAPLTVSNAARFSFRDLKGGRVSNVVAYALRRITCARPTRVRFVYGNDNALRLWVNGELAHADLSSDTSVLEQGVAELALPQGASTLLVELTQYKDAWSLFARFETLEGQRLRLDANGRLLPGRDVR